MWGTEKGRKEAAKSIGAGSQDMGPSSGSATNTMTLGSPFSSLDFDPHLSKEGLARLGHLRILRGTQEPTAIY